MKPQIGFSSDPARACLTLPFQIRIVLICGLISVFSSSLLATQRDDLGYTQLHDELGAAAPTGVGVSVSQIEAARTNGDFGPTTSASQFSGKTFTFQSGSIANEGSGHANNVANQFYSNTIGLAPGVTDIDIYSASPWLTNDFLRSGTTNEPLVEEHDVQNHSWVDESNSSVADRLRRLDYAIVRDDFVSVVGTNNDTGQTLPRILTNSFNSVVVGLSDTSHIWGLTSIDGSQRIVPHIVATGTASDSTTNTATSFATAQVSGAAAVLIGAAKDQSAWNVAQRNEVIRSLLFAGATKEEFGTSWTNSSTSPLDTIRGAGELNLYRSYKVLENGRQLPDSQSTVSDQGWDLGTADSAGADQVYFFDVTAGQHINEFSVALVWNREVTDGNSGSAFSAQHNALANLNLRLHQADGFSVGSQLAASVSDDNVEHIYLNDTLGLNSPLSEGRYAIVVSSDSGQADYGLSWFRRMEEDRQWVAAAATDSWGSESNWDNGQLPENAWRAVLSNDLSADDRVSQVEANWTVARVDVSGTAGRMVLEIDNSATLTARGGTTVNAGGAISGGGSLVGDLDLIGEFLVNGVETLTTDGDVSLAGDLDVGTSYLQDRGTTTDLFAIFTANDITGQFATPAGNGIDSHLGNGYFLQQAVYGDHDVMIEIVAALPGDANGDFVVDVFDFNIWNQNRNLMDTDWTTGDFNLDGKTDDADFALWKSNQFTVYVPTSSSSALVQFATIPEPAGLMISGIALLGFAIARRRQQL